MAKRFDVRTRKAELDLYRGDDNGGTIWSLGTNGNPLNGTESADFLLALLAGTISGLGGDDLILGSIADLHVAPANNFAFASAFDLDRRDSAWTIDENPLVAGDTSVPHATVYVLAEAGRREYFSIFIAAGATITIDIDGADGALGGADDGDTIVDLFHEGDLVNAVAGNDDSAVTDGGYGSVQDSGVGLSRDSFLTFTAAVDGLYYIRIGQSDGGDNNFEGGEEFLLNVSLTGHVTGTPGVQDGDFIIGGDGDDQLFGAGGLDNIDGGEGNDVILGGSGHDSIQGGTGADMLDGGTGMDEVSYAGSSEGVTVNLATGIASGGDAAGDTIANFENVTGSFNDDSLTGDTNDNLLFDLAGNDTLDGAGGNDQLFGGEGNDVLIGGSGDDFMRGDSGNDIYAVDSVGDTVQESIDGGADTIFASVSFTLTAGVSIERLAPTTQLGGAAINFTGNEFANRIEGNNGVNILRGEGGDDTLFGFFGNDLLDGGAGADTMQGGLDNDTYYVDQAGDLVLEFANEGTDIVYTTLNYTLGAGQQVEILSTASQAGTAALVLLGNGFDQTVYGNAGANYLDGGAGTDTLVGFGGDDSYVVDGNEDYVAEFAGGGNDTVYVRGSFSLGAGQEVETLAAFSQAGTAAIVIVGNGIGQILYGNAGANYLDGGAGTDTLVGFGGDDSYVVDGNEDYVAEFAGGGNDTVYVRGSFSLGSGQEVETLAAFSQAGTAAIVIVGNGIAQRLFGNAGNNYLDGGGGIDVMQGFGGNDTYLVDNSGDFIVEVAGEGNDIVYALASFTLTAGQEIETLSAISQAETTALDLAGNERANTLYGNAGANVLNGGAGNDFLQGFGGADSFQFTTAPGAANADTIADFVSGTDKLALDDAIFAGIGAPGSFNANAFATGTAATNAAHRIVYNSQTGQLFYDADGNGAGAAVLFATLSGAPILSASDFQVI